MVLMNAAPLPSLAHFMTRLAVPSPFAILARSIAYATVAVKVSPSYNGARLAVLCELHDQVGGALAAADLLLLLGAHVHVVPLLAARALLDLRVRILGSEGFQNPENLETPSCPRPP